MHLSRTTSKIFLACVMILVFTFVLSGNRAYAASVTAENQKDQEAKNVINVTGTNNTLILSMKLQQQSQLAVSPVVKGTATKSNQLKSLLKIGIFIGGIILGIAFVLYQIIFDHKKKTTA